MYTLLSYIFVWSFLIYTFLGKIYWFQFFQPKTGIFSKCHKRKMVFLYPPVTFLDWNVKFLSTSMSALYKVNILNIQERRERSCWEVCESALCFSATQKRSRNWVWNSRSFTPSANALLVMKCHFSPFEMFAGDNNNLVTVNFTTLYRSYTGMKHHYIYI